MNDFFLGILGCLGFEAMRFYKKILADEDPIPSNRIGYYVATLICLGLFSGSVSVLMALPNKLYCLYIGFSVPSSVGAVKGIRFPGTRRDAKVIEVDDVARVDESTSHETASKSDGMVVRTYGAWLDSFFD